VIEATDAEVAALRARVEGYQAELEKLRAAVEAIRRSLAAAPVTHFDETGFRVARRRWTPPGCSPHSAASQFTTHGPPSDTYRASPLMRSHHALARRLLQREDGYLRYTRDPRVPFDNNAAEREIRMGNVRIKISGSMRQWPAPRRSAPSAPTCPPPPSCGHSIGMLDVLTRAASGSAWVPRTP